MEKKVKDRGWLGLVNIESQKKQGERCHFLIGSLSGPEALVQLLQTEDQPQASGVLLLDGPGETLPWNSLAGSLQAVTKSSAVALLKVDPATQPDFLEALIVELSHNQVLDVALWRLSKQFGLPLPVVFSHGDLLPFLSVRLAGLTAASSLLWWSKTPRYHIRTGKRLAPRDTEEHRPQDEPVIEIDKEMARHLRSQPGTTTFAVLGKQMAEQLKHFRFENESDEASTLAKITSRVAPAMAEYVELPQERRVQAQVYEWKPTQKFEPREQLNVAEFLESTAGEELRKPLENTFRADSVHQVVVFIGVPREGWIQSPAAFPEEQVPPLKYNFLQVVFVEPTMMPDPQVATLLLPAAGESQKCEFFFRTAREGQVEARVVVLYRNRVLQTLILSGLIVPDPREAPEDARIEFKEEVVVNAGLANLADQSKFKAALVLNHARNGKRKVLAVINNTAQYIDVDNLKGAIENIDDKLNGCDWATDDFRALDAEGTVGLLRFLARHGSLLYNGIARSQFTDGRLLGDEPIQVIAAKPESRLPVEFMYSKPSPSGKAKLCDGAEAALRDGKCPAKCGTGKAKRDVICPLGFWGLSRVIEWHLYRPEVKAELRGSDFALQLEKAIRRNKLNLLKSAVLGASNHADAVVKGSVAKVEQKMCDKIKTSARVTSWKEWVDAVKKLEPSMLILIPHTGKDKDDIAQMAIGKNDWLQTDQIRPEHVVAGKGAAPVVLLLGCETGAPDIPYEGFVAQLRVAGAAIVVSTAVEVLGRQATPLAARFLEKTAEMKKKNATFGDVILEVRRSLLREGFPVVLALSSYGDADWRL